MTIEEALAKLDPQNDAHWTDAGLPTVQAVADVLGRAVTRREITDAAPRFVRSFDPERSPDAEPEGDGSPSASEPEGSALGLPLLKLLASAELCERAFRELESKIADATHRMREAKQELQHLHRQADVLSMHMERIKKSDPNRAIRDIQHVLQRSTLEREERAERLRAARASTGGQPTSYPLDDAMARKNSRGAGRPPARLIAQEA